jgi:hypothetical protein
MNEWILPCVFLSSFLTGIVIFMLDEEQRALRTVLNLAGAFVKSRWSASSCGALSRTDFRDRLAVLPGMD